MDAKQRYRLRQKLQAALLRLCQVIGQMQKAQVDFNKDNAATVEAVLHLLADCRKRGRNSACYDDLDSVVDRAEKAINRAGKRRHSETFRRAMRRVRTARKTR